MKKIFTYLSVAFVVFSCTKDAEHQKFSTIDIKTTTNVIGANVRFSAFVSNYSGEEIIDHGFIWGTRVTGDRGFSDSDLDMWIFNGVLSSTDDIFKKFLFENGIEISLGKFENSGLFTYETNTTIIGRIHLIMAYIKTDKYITYSKVDIFENMESWSKRNLTFDIPNGQYFTVNDKMYVMFYYFNRIGEFKKVDNDYSFDIRTCPGSFDTFYFTIGDIAYFSRGNSTMWKYNTMTDTWTSLEQPNIPNIGYSVSFASGQKGYRVVYNSINLQDNSIYEFNPESNVWTKKNESGLTDLVKTFHYRGKIYAYDNKNIWYFDENLTTFQFKSQINIGSVYSIVTLDDRVYMISRTGNIFNIFIYNPENDSTEKLCVVHNYYNYYSYSNIIGFNNKIVFLPINQSCLYELDISGIIN